MSDFFKKTNKFDKLILMYKNMAENGYKRRNGEFIPSEKVYGDLEPARHKNYLRELFQKFKIKTVLDYGSGKGNWNSSMDGGQSLKDYLQVDEVFQYEPSLKKDKKIISDCSLSFDVLEHVFISDIPFVINDIFSYATRLVVLNVACYKAAALLPNGENAHITVRHPLWWKGSVDTIARNFPNVSYSLIASTSYSNATVFPETSHFEQIKNPNFVALEK